MIRSVTYSKIIVSGMLFILLLTIGVHIQAQPKKSWSVYVWDFGTRDGQKNNLTKNFTHEFEGALIFAALEQRRDL